MIPALGVAGEPEEPLSGKKSTLTHAICRAYKTGQEHFLEVQLCTRKPQPNLHPLSHTSSMSFTRIARTAASSLIFRQPLFTATELGAVTAPLAELSCLRRVWKTEVRLLSAAPGRVPAG